MFLPHVLGFPKFDFSVQVAVDVVHHQTMAELQSKVNSREKIVGWFSTGTDISGSDALIHNFYTNECPNPVHLILDTSLEKMDMGVKAYVSRVLMIEGSALAREFQEIPCEVRTSEAERIAGDLMLSESTNHLPTELEGLSSTLESLDQVLEAAEDYVGQVVNGSIEGDVAVGRQLAEAISAVPRLSEDSLKKLVRNSQNDIMITSYLADLVRAHVALSDKLGTMQLPLM